MIRTCGAGLNDFLHCAACIDPVEIQTYFEMTGRVWDANDVASQLWMAGGHCWAFRETVGNFPAAVGGYLPVRTGVWASWFMATPAAWARGNQITDRVAAVVRSMFENPEVRRLETVTLATRTRARDWYERIGLTYESTARAASATGQDLVTYVALRP